MADIKTKDMKPKTVKTIDKAIAWTERVKDPVVYANEKVKDASDGQANVLDYGEDKIKYVSNRAKDEAIYASKKTGNYTKDKAVKFAKDKYQKKKLIKGKGKDIKGTVQQTQKGIKTANRTIKNTEKAAKEAAKASKRALERGRQLAIKSAKATAKGIKIAVKATVSAIKGIIAGVKGLIGMLAAGGTLAIVAIVIICLVGLLITSIFGIFFSSEKTTKTGYTMKEVVSECNQEFGNKLETIQKQNPHDEYVLEGNMASWKDILLVYTVKQSNGINQTEVITVDDNKKKMIKEIFWEMNEVTSEVKTETVKKSAVNTSDTTIDEQKRVLHIYVKSKTAEEMKTKYAFNALQIKQLYPEIQIKYPYIKY